MNVATKHKMDLARPDTTPQIFCVQGDTLSRTVELELLEEGTAWEVPEDVLVLITYYRPDGGCGTYNQMPDGSQAWAISQNVVTIHLAPQMLTAAGLVRVQLKLIKGEVTISTFMFQVMVRQGLVPGSSPENYTDWLTAYLPQTTGAEPGQYLTVAQVDQDGRVIQVAAGDIPMLADLQARLNALEVLTAGIEEWKARMASLEETAADVRRMGVRLTALENQSQLLTNRTTELESVTATLNARTLTGFAQHSADVRQLETRIGKLEAAGS